MISERCARLPSISTKMRKAESTASSLRSTPSWIYSDCSTFIITNNSTLFMLLLTNRVLARSLSKAVEQRKPKLPEKSKPNHTLLL